MFPAKKQENRRNSHIPQAGNRRFTRRSLLPSRTKLEKPSAPPLTFFSLPSIPDSIPSSLVFGTEKQEIARLLLTLIDQGVVTEDDANAGSPSQIISAAFNRMVGSYRSRMRFLKPDLDISDNFLNFGFGEEDLEYLSEDYELPKNGLLFGIYFPDYEYGSLRERVEELEAAHPGLGQTALSVLFSTLAQTGYALTPDYALELARYHHWMGEDDESMVREEYENEEDFEGSGCLTRSKFDEEIPTWVSNARKVLDVDALTTLASGQSLAAETAQAILNALTAEEGYDYPIFAERLLYNGGSCVKPAAYLEWDAGGVIMPRLIDDQEAYAGECGFTDYAAMFISDGSAENISETVGNLEKWLKRLEAADRLIDLLITMHH